MVRYAYRLAPSPDSPHEVQCLLDIEEFLDRPHELAHGVIMTCIGDFDEKPIDILAIRRRDEKSILMTLQTKYDGEWT